MNALIELLLRHGALVVFVATLLARVGAPVPAAPLMVVAGGLSLAGGPSAAAAFSLAVVANVLGDAAWFWAGRAYGSRVLGLLCRWSLSPDSCVRQSESLIARWGASSLVAAKFVPGVSVVAAPMTGAAGMSVARFVAYDALAGAIWSAAFLGLGLVFSDQVQELLGAMAEAGLLALAALVLALAGFVAWRWWRRRRFARAAALPRIAADELQALIEGGEPPLIIDVRPAAAAALDPRRLPGALRLDLQELGSRAAELPADREIVLYCNCPNEASAALAAKLLLQRGRPRARPLAGGLDGWQAAGRALDAHGDATESPAVDQRRAR
jgi:membrane protein DedA with SNARE-associated domain/rhodanese-related sulfurtransferase